MIERVIEYSIRNRGSIVVAGLCLALGGVYAVYRTPVDAIPDVSENQIVVFTEWPGHSPPEIEAQISYPLSLHLQGMAGVRVVRSSSDFNFSMLSVIFDDSVDFTAARERVAQKLPSVRDALPPGVSPMLAADAAATGQIFWYTVEGVGYDPARLRALQDWYVRPQLSAVPGVAEVASVGGACGEYAVEVDPRRMLALGVRLADVLTAVERSNAAVGGDVIHKANAEYIVRGVGWLGQNELGEVDPQRVRRDLENVLVPRISGGTVRLAEVSTIALSPRPRRGVLEKDGNEVTGGVVLMRQGENALDVTRRIKDKIAELQPGLPSGVRVVAFYDRTPLIRGAIATVTGTLLEAILTATVCVLLVLLHLRTSFVIVLTLPLAALASFLMMGLLRWLGIADIQTNVMSLAGIAISIGVLVDSSVVMAENVMYRLHERFGDAPVTGDVREVVLSACRTVGRPIFFSVVIMLLSFLPVFALGGIEGKMFRPLAFTKCFALVAVAVLAITLVPALCTVFIRGRLRSEMDSWLVRSLILAYRPLLAFVLDRPVAIVWFVGATFLVGVAPFGKRWILLATLATFLAGVWFAARRVLTRWVAVLTLAAIALVAEQSIEPLGYVPITALDEGMVMDMPITVPWASVTQAADDLKARDMILCRFPEVDMVVGKAGRAETSTDPAPLDMIETMVNFRPPELWPRRKLRPADAERLAHLALAHVRTSGMARDFGDVPEADLVNEALMVVLPTFDAQMREFAYQHNQGFERQLGHQLVHAGQRRIAAMLRDNGSLERQVSPAELARTGQAFSPTFLLQLARDLTPEDVRQFATETVHRMEEYGYLQPGRDTFRYQPGPARLLLGTLDRLFGGVPPTFFSRLEEGLYYEKHTLWKDYVRNLNGELTERAAAVFACLIVEEFLLRATDTAPDLLAHVRTRRQLRSDLSPRAAAAHHHDTSGGHVHQGVSTPAVDLDPHPLLTSAQEQLTKRFADGLILWPVVRSELVEFGGEMDRAVQMPGWTNVWTMPIQNRVDMLSTGVNTTVGVRVLGRRLEDVIRASDDVAAALAKVPGAVNVLADRLRGKGYLQIHPDRERAARLGVRVADINELVEVALGGKVVTQTVEGRERHGVRVRYPRTWRSDEDAARDLPVPVFASPGQYVRLADVADVRIAEGPATIKSENGLLRNYVRSNVRGRDSAEFVEEARRVVAARVELPPGVFLEWTGQFEHEQAAWNTLLLILPLVLGLIFLILWLTYHDFADAVLMMLAVPGALAGGVFAQWLFGYPFSVTVVIGYLACFGMATATGIIMLVYLREALERAGGLENLSLEQLRQAVMEGAVHRLRPKLLTECTMILGLAPLLWTHGVGAEVIKPMVVPVLGGILIADEVIDLFLPVVFFWERRRRWQRVRGNADLAKAQGTPSPLVGEGGPFTPSPLVGEGGGGG